MVNEILLRDVKTNEEVSMIKEEEREVVHEDLKESYIEENYQKQQQCKHKQHQQHQCHCYQQQHLQQQQRKTNNNKKGFRIDEILFSAANNLKDNNPKKCYTVSHLRTASVNSFSMSPRCLSDTSSNTPSPISFVFTTNDFKTKKERNRRISNSSPTSSTEMKHFISNPHYSPQNSYLKLSDDLYTATGSESKKPRTSFTPDQIQKLEDSFQDKRYLNHTERIIIANELNLTDCQIKTWFQNRRMKMKRQYKEAVEKGYLVPYHPYPFPRYSRLTPAHFALLPALNSRRDMDRHYKDTPNNSYENDNDTSCIAGINESRCRCCLSPPLNSNTTSYKREKFHSRYTSTMSKYTSQSNGRREYFKVNSQRWNSSPDALTRRCLEKQEMDTNEENEHFQSFSNKFTSRFRIKTHLKNS